MMEAEAAVWMRRLAALSRDGSALGDSALPDPALPDPALPDPVVIWWQARLLDRQEAQVRVARPIAIAQWVSLVVAVVGVVVLCSVYSAGIAEMIAPIGLAVWAGGGGWFVLTLVALRRLFAA